jgi:hypothetical protein
MMPRVTKIPYIPIDPVSLICPQCGTKPGQACDMLKGEVELVHVKRIRAAAINDVAAKKALRK